MGLQRTIKHQFELIGRDFYGGNYVRAEFFPADVDMGVVFETSKGEVKAELANAVPCRRSILLRNPESGAEIINVEHVLATLYAYGVDNARINVHRIAPGEYGTDSEFGHKLSFGSHNLFARMGMKSPDVFPNVRGEELPLCNLLDNEYFCPVEQEKERKTLRLKNSFVTEKMSFIPDNEALYMHATTRYNPIGFQAVEFKIDSQTYKTELAGARRYAEHLKIPMKILGKKVSFAIGSAAALVLYPSFGIGHGFNFDNIFIPVSTVDEWREQEQYPEEIARHTIVDRLGAIALLDGRLEGVECYMKFSNHSNDIKVLKELESNGDLG